MRLFPIGLTCAVCATTAALAAQGDALMVQGSRVNVRANPNTGAPVLLQLERGQRVVEVGRHEAWVNVEIPNFAGREGWIHRSLLAPAAPPPPRATTTGAAAQRPQQQPPQQQPPQQAQPQPQQAQQQAQPQQQPTDPLPLFDGSRPVVEVRGDGVNVRQGPGTNTSVVTKLNRGERLPTLGERGSWTQVDLGGGRSGWIHDSLLAPVSGPGGTQTAAADPTPQRPAAAGAPPERAAGAEGEAGAAPAAAAGAAGGAATQQQGEQVRVLAEAVSLRREPSRLAPVVARVRQGDSVTVVDREGAWVEVAVAGAAGGDARGWVHGSLVGSPDEAGATTAAEATTAPGGREPAGGPAASPQPPSPTAANGPAGPGPEQRQAQQAQQGGRVEITGRVVNVRRAPSTSAPVVAQVNQGRQLNELSRDGDWVRVALDGRGNAREGWVYGPLVRPVAPAAVARAEQQPQTPPQQAATAMPPPPAGTGGTPPGARGAPSAAPPAPTAAGAAPPSPPPAAGPSPDEKAPEGSRMTTAALAPGDAADLDAEERFDRFKTTVESLNDRVRRAAGVDVFASVEDLGDGTVELTATRAWLAAPEAARRANLDTLFRLWDSVHASDDDISVRIVDDGGDVAMEKRR